MKDEFTKENYSMKQILKFIIPSVLGVVLLMVPFDYEGGSTILVALLSKEINTALARYVSPSFLIVCIIGFTALITLYHKLFEVTFIKDNPYFDGIFSVNCFWVGARLIGLALSVLVYFKIGPEMFWSDDTGGLILHDLIVTLFAMFFVAGFLLPLLTDFGLLEFIGVLLHGVMRPVFNLPGRSSIDCVASWVGDGTIGVALTNKQYLDGYYTAREAAVISTTFSLVSITFCFVVLETVRLTQYFAEYYFTVTTAGLAAALILPRIPPLSRKKDVYYAGVKNDRASEIPRDFSRVQWGLHLALERADSSGHLGHFLINGFRMIFDLWCGVLPVIMAFGTLTLVVAESTPFFALLGKPFVPVLQMLGVPEALAASRSMVVGFADMFLPAVIAGKALQSEAARFFVASLSVTQLIYMSEMGAVILGSKLPVSFGDLFVLFIERTVIALPIVAFFTHLFF